MSSSFRGVAVRYFSLLLDALGREGVDGARLLALAGIPASRFERGDNELRVAEVQAFLQAAGQLSGRRDLGFALGPLIKLNSHDMLGYGMLSCRDLDQLLRLTSRHYHLINGTFSMRYQRRATQAEVLFSPVVAMPPETLEFMLEVIAVSVYHQTEMVLGPGRPMYDIRLSMAAPPHRARYAELAAARFHFDPGAVPGVTVLFGVAMLDRPLPMAAPEVVRQIEQRIAPAARRPVADAAWGPYLTMMLREAQGRLTLDDIARRLEVSPRTIDRQLKKEKLQFRDLALQVRFDCARELLSSPGATASAVAEQMGFSDPANFSRAFRRHAGMTPGEFMATLAAPAAVSRSPVAPAPPASRP